MNKTYNRLGITVIVAVLFMLLSFPLCGLGARPGGDSVLTDVGVWMFIGGLLTLPAVAVLAMIIGVYDAIRPKRQVLPSPPASPPSPDDSGGPP